MGRFSMRIELANQEDRTRVSLGQISEDQVRRVEIEGVVDTGAARLVLPESVVKALGLEIAGDIRVRYADHRRGTGSLARYVWLKMLDRDGVFTAIVEPKRTDALIGAIVLEELDLVVDCISKTCHPRDPHRLVAEIE